MATTQSVVIYTKPTPAIGAGTAIAMVGSSTSDGATRSVAIQYFFEFVAGVPGSRVEIPREDFLAIRQLLNLAIP